MTSGSVAGAIGEQPPMSWVLLLLAAVLAVLVWIGLELVVIRSHIASYLPRMLSEIHACATPNSATEDRDAAFADLREFLGAVNEGRIESLRRDDFGEAGSERVRLRRALESRGRSIRSD
jgi:hypothetical protein